jgi:hypothetical protein
MEHGRTAYNCVVNNGRLTSRKALTLLTGQTGTGPSADVKSMYETIRQDGESNIVVGAGATVKQLRLDNNTWVDMTPVTTPTAGNWQFQGFNDQLLATQVGHVPVGWTISSGSWVNATYTPPGGYTTEQFSVCHAAFGHMWIANGHTKKDVLFGSALLAPLDFASTGSGSIDMDKVWANGQDEIVAITSHSGYLIVLGKKQVVLFQAPADLAITGFTLVEVLKNVGCVSRDSVASIGDDIVWCAPQGLVSLGRLLQEKSLPMGNLSRNVHSDFLETMENANYALKSAFANSGENLIVVSATKGAWCFNTRTPTQNGAAVATRWDQFPYNIFTVIQTRNGNLYFGGEGGRMYLYTGYGDTNNKYKLRFYTGYLDYGAPSTLKFPKKFSFVLKGSANQQVAFKWAFDYKSNYSTEIDTIGAGVVSFEYGTAEYNLAEYGAGETIEELRVNASKSGRTIQIGIECDIAGEEVALYAMSMYATMGKTY